LAGRLFPRDETVTAITVAMKVQARDRRKKGAKPLMLQKDCTAMTVFADCSADRNAEMAALRFETLIVKKVLPQISPKIKGFVLGARNEG
jgi:hypothetical protein